MRDATLNIATGELIEHGIDCPLCDHCDTLAAVAYKLQRERNVALEQRDALLAALWTAEEVLGNNIVGLSDLLDLRVRQGDPETLRRLDELNKGWLAVVRAIKACEVQS